MSIFKKALAYTPTPAEAPEPKAEKSAPVDEITRIKNVLRRPLPTDGEKAAMAENLKLRLGKGVVSCACVPRYKKHCCIDLLPIQAWALSEIERYKSLFGPIGVGHGKTLLDLLAAMVFPGCKTAVLLLPTKLKAQLLERDVPFYGQHWKLPNIAGGKWLVPGRPTLWVVAYSELSGSRASDLLEKIKPDLFICDEVHNLANRTAVRTRRFLKSVKASGTPVLEWSGTITQRGPEDYAHLMKVSLRENSVLPDDYNLLKEWSEHLAPGPWQKSAGSLRFLMPPEATDARPYYQKRLVETPGVICSGDAKACQASLVIGQREFKASATMKQISHDIAATWERPDGEVFYEAPQVAMCQKQVASGFYYVWRFPRGETKEQVDAWKAARKEWHKELRDVLKKDKTFMDSPKLCMQAAIRWARGYAFEGNKIPPFTKNGPLPTWKSESWQTWHELRHTVRYVLEPVWFDETLVKDACEWINESAGVTWYGFSAIPQKLKSLTKEQLVVLNDSEDADAVALKLTGSEKVVASIASHGEGKDFSMFHRSLVINPPPSGKKWEQLLGRSHRQGQLADEVTVDVYRHTEHLVEAVDKAKELAEYAQTNIGNAQKLVTQATWLF